MPQIKYLQKNGIEVDVATNNSYSTTASFKESQMSRLDRYATGGFPDAGQMFIAREAGAEMVGSIGGRTAVANNDQIVAGISAGVYNAMMAASGSGSGGDWNIQIVDTDGRVKSETVISAAERKNRRDGRTIIPLGV